MRYRRWNWADKVLGHHGDKVAEMDRFYEARRQTEDSHWWWLERRFTEDMQWDNLVRAGGHG